MQRTKVLAARVTGTIVELKPKFGWIQPDAPINHPEATKRKGKVYLSFSDLEGAVPAVGDKVNFFVYSDGTGLGAMNCKTGDTATVQKPISKPTALGPGAAPGGTQAGRQSLGDDHVFTGKIQQWNGSHGWILPLDTITHPLFKGKVYLKSRDVDTTEPLKVGSLVNFLLYTDSQGLGAEHCTIADPDASPLAEDGDPTVLKAKPKGGFPTSPFPSSPPNSPGPDGGDGLLRAKAKTAADSAASSLAGAMLLKARPKMGASMDPASTVLKAKPKMSAGSAAPTSVTLPAHLSPELAKRLVAWMWDRGG